VDLVELSETVVQASEWFRHVNAHVVHRPNVRLRIDDGRNYMFLTRKRYDVITADIVQPHHAGAGNLYSLEYFQLARRSLGPGGLMVQWLGGENEAQYKLILRTFVAAFPDSTLWGAGTLLVGTKQPLKIDPTAFERKLADPAYRSALSSVGIRTFDDLLRTYSAGSPELSAYVGEGPLLTDDRPAVEYFRGLPASRPIDYAWLTGDVMRHVMTR
jgi:spermidine synthase